MCLNILNNFRETSGTFFILIASKVIYNLKCCYIGKLFQSHTPE